MKKFKPLYIVSVTLMGIVATILFTSINGCVPSKAVAAKSGVQLWGENCQRCHNTPSPSTFSSEQWETVGMHMQTRALLTNDERDKIVDFLKSNK